MPGELRRAQNSASLFYARGVGAIIAAEMLEHPVV